MNGPKSENVRKMFDSIASDYDNLNHLLSLGVDKLWRARAMKSISDMNRNQRILDIACGTGDFSIEIAKHTRRDSFVTGIDLSEGMLAIMEGKVAKENLQDRISTIVGNCEDMQFERESFDVVTIGFGIRNFENREKALREILRVLKQGGKIVILELSIPEIPVIKGLYKFYFKRILPLVGGLISGDSAAYRYLPASVLAFPKKKEWIAIMENCGFKKVSHRALTLGICRMYIGEKS